MVAIAIAHAPHGLRAQQRERGIVTIIVTDTHDESVPEARLTVRGSEVETPIIGGRIEVKIGTQRDGTQLLRVEADGYLPATFSIHIADDRPYELHVQLERPGTSRATAARPRRVWMTPVGQGPTRLLLGDGEIADDSLVASWRTSSITELMRRLLGVDARARLGSVTPMGRPTKGGSLCAMALFLDGNHPTQMSAIESLYGAQDFDLIEIFRVGTSVPSAYRRAESRCGAMIFWTHIRS
jgi:hypothetical protein